MLLRRSVSDRVGKRCQIAAQEQKRGAAVARRIFTLSASARPNGVGYRFCLATGQLEVAGRGPPQFQVDGRPHPSESYLQKQGPDGLACPRLVTGTALRLGDHFYPKSERMPIGDSRCRQPFWVVIPAYHPPHTDARLPLKM